ncbi:hypothetical protein [Ensifer sp.]|uniref:hypothetical protein n=1 Tax=Ensifer sp. TaxID=1872086 RepID=UPI002E148D63
MSTFTKLSLATLLVATIAAGGTAPAFAANGGNKEKVASNTKPGFKGAPPRNGAYYNGIERNKMNMK